MVLPGSQIERINTLPKTLDGQGFELWFWQLIGPALMCDTRRLAPDIWQKEANSCLVYGILIPAVTEQDRGDLLVMLSQHKDYYKKRKFGSITRQQREDIYELILEIDFVQVSGYHLIPPPLRNEIFQKYELLFLAFALPRQAPSGKLYRGYNKIDRYKIAHPDEQGRIKCPKCRHWVSIKEDLLVTIAYKLEENLDFVNAICQSCNRAIGIRIDKAKNRRDPQIPLQDQLPKN